MIWKCCDIIAIYELEKIYVQLLEAELIFFIVFFFSLAFIEISVSFSIV